MDPLPPPNQKRGRGKRTITGVIPPLPSIDDIKRITDPEPEYVVPPEIPREAPDPTRLTIRETEEFKGVLAEIHARRNEALKIFRPLPEQERFFASNADERLAIGGNRGGKTTATMIEIARAVTGQDPYDKYPKEDGIFILVAIDLSKCAKVFYKKLFKKGAFWIVRDPETREWRPFDPDADADLADEAKPAPPLIPKRFIASISWENKKDEIPKTVRLINGWELWFYSSGGEWPQGVDVDGVAFDEELERDGWYDEMSARLADRRKKNRKTGHVKSGKFIWSATPQSGTVQLFELYSRAVEEAEGYTEALERGEKPEPPSIQVFEFGIDSNQYIATHAKDALKKKYANKPEEYKVRIEGKFALFGALVYPEFAPKGVHGVPAFPIPDDWTIYAIIDPGRQVCAVLFFAIAPPKSEWAGRKIICDELYIRRCNAKIFAEQFVRRVGGRPIEAGVIDHRAGRITEIGSGKTHEQQYSDALKAQNFKFERGGHGFLWSSDDVKAGIEAVQNALHIVEGKTELVVMHDKAPNCCREMTKYSYRKTPSGVITDEPIKLNDHTCDDVRYACAMKLPWVKPRRKGKMLGYTNEYLEAKRKREKARKRQESKWGARKVG